MTPDAADALEEVKIAVPQRYKDSVVLYQYRSFWYILVGVLGGVNAVYYLLCLAFHWRWRFHLQADMVVPLLGLISYALEARRPWQYLINDRRIKLFVTRSKLHVATM